MRTIKTYRKVGAFYIAWEEDFSTVIDVASGGDWIPVIGEADSSARVWADFSGEIR
jgi:hypothetical protein